MTFDKDIFAALLENAKGYRSINQYARDADVSPAHISRLLRKLIDTAPSPEIIGKLAHNAYNEVTYDELMIAAGHILSHVDHKEPNTTAKPDSNLEKEFLKIIIPELYQGDFNCTIEKNTEMQNKPDLIIRLSNYEFSTWYIYLKFSLLSGIQDILNLYGIISTLELAPEIKLTIAVDSPEMLKQLKATPPKSIRGNIFVMLVDFKMQKIIKEERLCQY